MKKIKKALISVFNKDGLDEIVSLLAQKGVQILSTGGTQSYIESLGIQCESVENVTRYPSILGGRVKTLHPKVFGGILNRRDNENDQKECMEHDIQDIDLVIVDLYPFVQTVKNGGSHSEIIEKIDIGGVSLIRAAAKNYNDVIIVSNDKSREMLLELLRNGDAVSELNTRLLFAKEAFVTTASYDGAINQYFQEYTTNLIEPLEQIVESDNKELKDYKNNIVRVLTNESSQVLRYGENPHQKAELISNAFNNRFEYIQGKALSYNNLLDVEAATLLIEEFSNPSVAIFKHNTPCGVSEKADIYTAYVEALSCDPVSAFGGIIVVNRPIDLKLATKIDEIFFEVLIAPGYTEDALAHFAKKTKRIILCDKIGKADSKFQCRSMLGGVLIQERDARIETLEDCKVVSKKQPTSEELNDMLFGMKVVKGCKSNAIVIVKDKKILGAGYGQTSRVDALKQAIEKSNTFGFSLDGAVVASDAFFPFSDCVEIAYQSGIKSFIQPGGSIRDQESTDYADEHNLVMIHTGIRHFRH